MAARNFKTIKSHYGVQRFRTEVNIEVGMAEGDLVKIAGTGTNYATLILDGDPEQGTDLLLGRTASAGTQTASVDGVVDVELYGQGSICEAQATTVANINTDAKLLLLLNDYIACDRTAATAAGVLTLDEDEGTDAAVHGFIILDGDIVSGTIRAAVGPATFFEGTV